MTTSDLLAAVMTNDVGQRTLTVYDRLNLAKPDVEAQLAGTMDTDAFLAAAVEEVKRVPELEQVTGSSLIGAVMLAAQLRLEIGPALGHFHLTATESAHGYTCRPIIGYQGYIELGYRSGRVKDIDAFLIHDGDHFDHGANSERGKFFEWHPAETDEPREWTHVLAYARTTTGGMVWSRLTRAQVYARRPRFWADTAWAHHEDDMALKTGFRALAPKMPKSTELGRALRADENIVAHVSGDGLTVHADQDRP